MKHTLVALVAMTLGASCATSTMIITDPPGAKVVAIDEKGGKKDLGATPVKFETSMWIWEKQKLEVTAPTGEKQTVELSRSEVDAVPTGGAVALTCCTGGVGICGGLPIFLAGGLKLPAETKVTFSKKTGFQRTPATTTQQTSQVAFAF